MRPTTVTLRTLDRENLTLNEHGDMLDVNISPEGTKVDIYFSQDDAFPVLQEWAGHDDEARETLIADAKRKTEQLQDSELDNQRLRTRNRELEQKLHDVQSGRELHRLRDRVAQLETNNAVIQTALNRARGDVELAQEVIARDA